MCIYVDMLRQFFRGKNILCTRILFFFVFNIKDCRLNYQSPTFFFFSLSSRPKLPSSPPPSENHSRRRRSHSPWLLLRQLAREEEVFVTCRSCPGNNELNYRTRRAPVRTSHSRIFWATCPVFPYCSLLPLSFLLLASFFGFESRAGA